ncbi:MAG: VWA domain-containing protein [Planctomycetota bacterium]
MSTENQVPDQSPAERTPDLEARLTAYALGEVEFLNAVQRVEIEALLERDPAARALVDEVRLTASELERELAAEDAPGLTDAQRAAIASASAPAPRRKLLRLRDWTALAAAAGITALVGTWMYGDPDSAEGSSPDQTVAMRAFTTSSREFRGGQTLGVRTLDRDGFGASTGDPNLPQATHATEDLSQLSYRKRLEAANSIEASRISSIGNSVASAGVSVTIDPNRSVARLGALGYVGGDEKIIQEYAKALHDLGYAGNVWEWSGQHLYDLQREVIRPRWVSGFMLPDDVPPRGPGNESYGEIRENPFILAARQPLSTFSIDVDTASYANVRRFLNSGQRPPRDAVRIEELINYFPYDYAGPESNGADDAPFAVHVDVGAAPWAPQHRLVRVALKGRAPTKQSERFANLVFLVDVSGSMSPANKLPLVQDSLRMLVEHLTENDSVAIVVYAGSSGLALPATHGEDKAAIRSAIDNLRAGGSTNGGEGIQLAYRVATENFIQGGINRVLLATDGDFNVGITGDHALEDLIAEKAQSGVFLTVLGYGVGNLKDRRLEMLSGRGNGNYAYIDGIREARKVLVDELGGTLETIAKDVKLQVDFNPSQVRAYRLIGYENRMLAATDFDDDKKDAGEIGAGHTVTALYEVVPTGVPLTLGVEASKYVAQEVEPTPAAGSGELLTVRLRYKLPDAETSTRFDVPLTDAGQGFEALSSDTRFAAAVAAFGMVLRDSGHRGSATLEAVQAWALAALGQDPRGYRAEFCDLVGQAQRLGIR